jgi:hypothetical protein
MADGQLVIRYLDRVRAHMNAAHIVRILDQVSAHDTFVVHVKTEKLNIEHLSGGH